MTETVESKKEKGARGSSSSASVSDELQEPEVVKEDCEVSDDRKTESDDENTAAKASENNVEELKKEPKLEDEGEDFKKRFYYLAAEMENMKKVF